MNLGSIPVNQISDETTPIHEWMDAKGLNLDVENVRFKGRVEFRGCLERVDENLSVGIHTEGMQTLTCSRCLENFDRQFNKDMLFTVEIQGQMTINLLPFLREEIVVEYPIRALCGENCKGLCPSCGANLNQGPCRCPSH